MIKKLKDDRCPYPKCRKTVKRVDHNDVTKSFYNVKSMTIAKDGSVSARCSNCGGELEMPVRKLNLVIKRTIRRTAVVINK